MEIQNSTTSLSNVPSFHPNEPCSEINLPNVFVSPHCKPKNCSLDLLKKQITFKLLYAKNSIYDFNFKLASMFAKAFIISSIAIGIFSVIVGWSIYQAAKSVKTWIQSIYFFILNQLKDFFKSLEKQVNYLILTPC